MRSRLQMMQENTLFGHVFTTISKHLQKQVNDLFYLARMALVTPRRWRPSRSTSETTRTLAESLSPV